MGNEPKPVTVEFEDGIAWVTLNRPEKRNAMSPTLNRAMTEVLDSLELDERCGVLVLTGAGDSFTAGQDLEEELPRTNRPPPHSNARVQPEGSHTVWCTLVELAEPTNSRGNS